MPKQIPLLLLLMLMAATVLSACSPAGQSAANTTASAHNNELIYATAKDINDMNPHLYAGSMPAQGIVYESLVENTSEGIKPLLASSWDISKDGKVYTFHLREDVKFHDGEPFNAEAVKQNIDAVQHNKEKHAWIKLSTKITDCKVIDEYTVQLTLSEPYYPTLSELSMTRPYVFLSPKDFKNGETMNGVSGYHGTGPYVLTAHEPEQSATFEANTSYWNGTPAIRKITAKVLPAGETTFLALQKGEVNFAFTDDRGADSMDVEAMKQLEASGDYRIVRSESMNTKMIVVNSSRSGSPVSGKAVREALWHAVDRKTISRDIMGGTETAANTLFSSNVNYADIPLTQRSYDLTKAGTLLESAGWKMDPASGIRSKNGTPLTMTLYYDSNSSSQKIQAELIQSAAATVGMQLKLTGEESASIANRRATGEYDLLFNQTWGLAYDPQSTIAGFTSGSAYLHTTQGIPQAKELYSKIDQVMTSLDEAKRKSLYADILNIVHDEAVFIPVTNGNITVVAPSNLQNISFKQTQYELPFESMSFQ
ncbi:staphylopine-dependent metal ABC transporter substrate-binding lipoprotein [Paenibacillus wulumuqiensis]|uniref:staphylopine-dependent metal ABC transporter substrate-binding lipoprotein n=1 Tax=Paenibacillus wulumuqiensis TaxID=1567107 RepID=UPI000619B688|nr:nickel ABC transporter substrate-binding protein [Paenibacillus wulumuqiensis]